jgi:hypothetical protein
MGAGNGVQGGGRWEDGEGGMWEKKREVVGKEKVGVWGAGGGMKGEGKWEMGTP